jgi:tRNA(Ile)-lysidine synthase
MFLLADEAGNRLNASSEGGIPSAAGLQLVRTAAYRAISGAWAAPVGIACSGGVDSTALVVLASEARRRGKIAPFVVFHVDHQSRPDSASDAEVVRKLCWLMGAPFVALTVDESGPVRGRSVEDVWRERRYRSLERAAGQLGLPTIITAHTRDDQVETVLMRFLSGSGKLGMRRDVPAGASGLSVGLLRPLIDIPRVELEEVLDIAGVVALQDPSNVDTRFRRNAVRHEVVPMLQTVFPHFDRAVLRAALLQQTDGDYCDLVAGREYDALGKVTTSGEVVLEKPALLALHPAIATRVIRLAARSIILDTDDRELTFDRVFAVLNAAGGRSGAMIQLPYRMRARIERDVIRFTMVKE